MTAATVKSVYLRGLRAGAPFVIVVVPFSLLFGVAATDAGLTLGQAMGFTVLVIAGASQFAALQMMVDQAGIAFVLLAALAVNLRMAMYSAALVPHIGAAPLWQRACVAYLLFDQTYLASVKAYEEEPDLTLRQKVAFFFGVATPITPVWCAMTAVGVLVGATIPEAAALDFALPITFLAMVAPMLRTSAHLAAAATSVVVALALSGLPSGFGLLIAAACAMAVGVLVEDRV
ncbi:AzlC family ABC transporter permease [Loktanella salsilacus]|jgi:predicted branched-subunit amino acid permease|uniref:Predicted branched-chain amino acid permease (Azaleucine resistance) n=1 Tax=Loktanella salsilacus TaxID=195913 RepID=A0A1I4DVB0_9RHOB|nr:AzlC family ABC transporter permease [Loktanella salsilacus]UTH43774.1 AzlC family ABC transporter permease [Loktanella salsilacus]UTH47485.1 AzlC family ABC transporter permease [Loktanella salsilacus]SFK97514.1 Predicted branched-chain amino acid permease (azaleucine resistance) [Loktanella salsilacus]|tara:strand:- start:1686 stop:2381 length:696 start_codon:yes stop_codon:yes gene_type:complete